MTDDNNALKVLVELHGQDSSSVSLALLKECYTIQRNFQFDRDRDVPIEHMRRLVEAEVAARLEHDRGGA
jgi:hypothetical protein